MWLWFQETMFNNMIRRLKGKQVRIPRTIIYVNIRINVLHCTHKWWWYLDSKVSSLSGHQIAEFRLFVQVLHISRWRRACYRHLLSLYRLCILHWHPLCCSLGTTTWCETIWRRGRDGTHHTQYSYTVKAMLDYCSNSTSCRRRFVTLTVLYITQVLVDACIVIFELW